MLQSTLLPNSRTDSALAARNGRASEFLVKRRETIEEHRQAVKRVLDVMRLSLTNPLDLAELAKVASMSRYHFLRVFETVTGVSPLRFLASLRIERAKRLLIETSLSVTTICFDVGYNSVGTFTRLFTEYVGVAPVSFRRLAANLGHRSLVSLIARYLAQSNTICRDHILSGCIEVEKDSVGISFVGVFETAIPQRRPVDGTVVMGSNTFELALPTRSQSYWIMAVGFSAGSDAIHSLTLSSPDLFVASRQVFCTNYGAILPSTCHLGLRRLDDFDPPILTALPILLGV
jgi:AraC-like DNA-binding protein